MLPLSIVVVSYGSAGFLAECLGSLLRNCAAYGPARVALVENHQDPAQVKKTRQAVAPFLKQGLEFWVAPANLGYGAAANWGWARLGSGAIKIVLNPDMSFPAGWLAAFIRPFEQDSQVGVVGCKLLTAQGEIQHAGGLIRRDLALAEHFGAGEPDDGRWDEACPVEFVTGAALGIRVDLVDRLGGAVNFDGRRVLYSWIGGTRRDWRGQGHFRALTEETEVWALSAGFEEVVVKTKNRYYDMRAVLAQLHFNVVKHEPNVTDSAESKVYLSKLLPAELARRHRSVRTVVYSE